MTSKAIVKKKSSNLSIYFTQVLENNFQYTKMASNSVNGTIKLHFKILLNKHNLRKNDVEIYGK